MLPRLAVTFVLAACVCSAPLSAQTPQPESDAVAPAHVAHVEGAVSLERDGRAENAPLNMPLLSGDRLRTGPDGRVEVLFADGSTLHLDTRSTLDVQSDDLVRLTDGRLRLNIQGRPSRAVAYRIDSPAGSARITQAGEYRIALLRRTGGQGETQLEVAVIRGAAEIFTDEGTTPIRAGERAYASAGLAPSYAYAYNSATWDGFDRWSESRRDGRLGVSSQYLPSDMQSYAPVLDQDGDWRDTPSYGYAWYPRVTSDWRPYYYGRWDSYPRYGWTWVGTERFAWPTHHYGRWGFASGAWFWTPSSRWAPAYVSWGYAPGYVSWCPLGFDNRPVIAIDLYRVGPNYYSPWRAWTAVSYSHFGGRDSYVHQRAVNWDRVDRAERPRFLTRPSPPGFSRDMAVPRNSAPIRSVGSRNVTPDGGRVGLPPRDNWKPSASPTRAESAGRDVAAPRNGVTPRYVNRGDEIVRSQFEPPAPRAAAPAGRPFDTAQGRPFDAAQGRPLDAAQGRSSDPVQGRPFDAAQGRPAREGYVSPRNTPRPENVPTQGERGGVETRTMPDTPARRVDPGFERPPVGSNQARPRTETAPTFARPAVQPRGYDPRTPRPDGWGDRPPVDPPYPAPFAPQRDTQPRAYERPRGGAESQAARERQPAQERAAPVERGERAAPAERGPNRNEGRQAPPERAAPAERAAPRSGAVAPPRPGGRGGA